MGGSVALPVIVEVAFDTEPLDTGTLTWTDISAYVKRSAGIDFSRGWDTEAAEPLAGRLTFTVNNDDGRFTPGETGAFGEVRNRLPVRVSRSGVGVLWTGLVESWRQSWENGVRSQVQVTCVDRWAAIRRLRINADRIEGVAQATAADYLFPFTDADTGFAESADRWPRMTLIYPTGGYTSVDYLAVEHPTDPSKSVAQLTTQRDIYWLRSPAVSTTWSMNDGISMSLTAKMPSGFPQTNDIVAYSLEFGIDGIIQVGFIKRISDGAIVAAGQVYDGSTNMSVQGATALSTSTWHTATITVARSGTTVTLNVYVDGVLDATDTDTYASDLTDTSYKFLIRPNSSVTTNYTVSLGGAMAHKRALSDDEAKAVSSLAATWPSETAAVRAARLLGFVSPKPTLSTTGTFTSTMSMQDVADKSLADALFECATAERGTIYTSRDGWPVLTSRSWRVASPVSFTIPAKALAADVAFTLDDQQLTNSATVDRMVGDTAAGTARSRNDASVAIYGEQNKSLQIWVDTDAQLLERANAEANIDAVAQPRSSDLMVDVLAKNATISAATLLGADIGQRIAVSGMPATAPATDEFYIETIADRITHTGWERTFTVSTRADYWTLQDATYGQIDNVFVLAF